MDTRENGVVAPGIVIAVESIQLQAQAAVDLLHLDAEIAELLQQRLGVVTLVAAVQHGQCAAPHQFREVALGDVLQALDLVAAERVEHAGGELSEGEIVAKTANESDSDTEEEQLGAEVKKTAPTKKNDAAVVQDNGKDEKDSIYLDVAMWKKEREALDDTFDAARQQFRKRGPWKFPSQLDSNKFRDVAVAVLNKIPG